MEMEMMVRAEDEASATIVAIAQTVQDELVAAFQDLTTALTDLTAKFTDWTGQGEGTIETINTITGLFGGLASILSVVDMVMKVFAASTMAASLPVLGISLAIMALIAIGVLLWQNWDWICAKAKEIWGALVEFFTGVWQSISATATEVWNGIVGFFTGIWESIITIFQENWDLILAILFPAVGLPVLIANNWEEIVAKVTEIWENVTNTVSEWWTTFTGKLAEYNPWNILKNIWGNLSTEVRKIFDSVTAQAEEWWGEFTEWLSSLNPLSWFNGGQDVADGMEKLSQNAGKGDLQLVPASVPANSGAGTMEKDLTNPSLSELKIDQTTLDDSVSNAVERGMSGMNIVVQVGGEQLTEKVSRQQYKNKQVRK